MYERAIKKDGGEIYMFCTKCGKELRDGSAFCDACGAVQGTREAASPAGKAINTNDFTVKGVHASLLCGLKLCAFGGKYFERKPNRSGRIQKELGGLAKLLLYLCPEKALPFYFFSNKFGWDTFLTFWDNNDNCNNYCSYRYIHIFAFIR